MNCIRGRSACGNEVEDETQIYYRWASRHEGFSLEDGLDRWLLMQRQDRPGTMEIPIIENLCECGSSESAWPPVVCRLSHIETILRGV